MFNVINLGYSKGSINRGNYYEDCLEKVKLDIRIIF